LPGHPTTMRGLAASRRETCTQARWAEIWSDGASSGLVPATKTPSTAVLPNRTRLLPATCSGYICGLRIGTTQLPGSEHQHVAGAGQTVFDALFTRRAGVHVDFHAHRHFHDLRSFPTHECLPSSVWREVRASVETRGAPDVAQGRRIGRRTDNTTPGAGRFPLGQNQFALGQIRRTRALIAVCCDGSPQPSNERPANSVRLPIHLTNARPSVGCRGTNDCPAFGWQRGSRQVLI
jgi:hypothetical protein